MDQHDNKLLLSILYIDSIMGKLLIYDRVLVYLYYYIKGKDN